MSKKLSNKYNLQINQELNNLLKKHNIDKAEYIRSVPNVLFYNIDDVVEGNKYIDKLICPICYNILNEPISCNSTKTSHTFCKECIQKSLEINDKCPMCKQKFESETNKKIEKLLQKLKFKCKFAEEGCSKILPYSIYFYHLNKCGYRDILYECQVGKYNYKKKIMEKCRYKGTCKKVIKHFKKCAFLENKCLFCHKNFFQINFLKHFSSSCQIRIIFNEDSTALGEHDDNGDIQGLCRCFLNDGEIYEGEVKEEGPNGFGIYYFENGQIFQGEWKNNKREGYGILLDNDKLIYQGEYKNNLKDGIGKEKIALGEYEGEYKNDKMEGYGIFHFNNLVELEECEDINNFYGYSIKYEGEWKNNNIDGYGIMYFSSGSFYNGEWKNGSFHGFGIIYIKDKEYYIGQHEYGNYEGYGIIYYYESKIKIKGIFKDGVLEGYGIRYDSNGDIIEGYWENGKLNGIAFLHKPNCEKYINYYEKNEKIFSEKIENI